MPTIKINDQDYDLDTLSDAAKQQIINIRAADQELADLQRRTALAQTARLTYSNALMAALPSAK